MHEKQIRKPQEQKQPNVDTTSLGMDFLKRLGLLFDSLSLALLMLVQAEVERAIVKKKLEKPMNLESDQEKKEISKQQLLKDLSASIKVFTEFYLLVTSSEGLRGDMQISSIAQRIGIEAMSLSNFIANSLKDELKLTNEEFSQIEGDLVTTYQKIQSLASSTENVEKNLEVLPVVLVELSFQVHEAIKSMELIFELLGKSGKSRYNLAVKFRKKSLKDLVTEIKKYNK